MAHRILVVQGHPDAAGSHFDHALARAYVEGAEAAGHEVRKVDIGTIDFPLIRSAAQWGEPDIPPPVAEAQQAVLWADHLVLVYPLWLGTMPALLKGFLEQLLRPDFAFGGNPGKMLRPLRGRSARVVVSMGMPALVYRLWFRAHSVKSLQRNILRFVGFNPVRISIVGSAGGKAPQRERWLRRMRRLGERAR